MMFLVISSLLLLFVALLNAENVEVLSNGEVKASLSKSAVTTDLLQSFSDAWNAHNLDKLMTFMSEDSEFHAVAGPDLSGKSWVGKDQVRIGFSQAFIIFPDAQWLDPVHFIAARVEGEPVRAVTESTFVGTRTTAEGEKLRTEARMVDIFTFDSHGKIRVKNAFRKDRPAAKMI
eukprot:gene14970-16668_t